MPFHSCWQPKQFVVIRPNACLTPFTAIITHFAWMTFWEESDSSSKASLWLFFYFFFFYTDCRYPVVIICSINTILSYYVHSSFKKKEKKRKGKKKILAHQCLGDDKEKIWREFSSSFPSFRSERYRAVMKLKYFYHKTLKAQPRNDAILWKKEKVLRVWCQYKPHIQC